MSSASHDHKILTREILRWNHQMNLVSRVDTARTLNGLVEHCVAGWDLLAQFLSDEPGFSECLYVDLGSGGGLPGLIWATSRHEAGHKGVNCFVEPRDKRAWFLQRVARALQLDTVVVQTARWGEMRLPVVPEGTDKVLISMKALRLTDSQVLAGYEASAGDSSRPSEIMVVRFMESDERSLASLEGVFVENGDHSGWCHQSTDILGSDNPRLLLTRYGR